MTTFFIDNLLLLIGALFYWHLHGFSSYLLLMGTIGILFDSAGLCCAYMAMGKGPGGPITALLCSS